MHRCLKIFIWIITMSIDRIALLSNYMDEIFLWQHQCNKMVFIDWLWKVLTEESEKEKSHLCVCHLVSLRTDMNMFPDNAIVIAHFKLGFTYQQISYYILSYWWNITEIRIYRILNIVMNFNIVHALKQRKLTHLNDKAFNFFYGAVVIPVWWSSVCIT